MSPGLDALLHDVHPSDTIVVYKLDRIGRSTAHVAQLVAELTERGVFIESISDGLNSSTSTGRAMLQCWPSSRRWTLIDRRAHCCGPRGCESPGPRGRASQTENAKARKARALHDSGESVPEMAKTLKLSIATV